MTINIQTMKRIYYLLFLLVSGWTLWSCANKAQGPTGGPKDETPPRVMRSIPENGAVNHTKKQIQIVFDENVTVEKVSENVIISPPQAKQPAIKTNLKVLTVTFEEELLDSTTYTIDFGNAIVDLNEKNPLKSYRFAFSTGTEIDTLQIAGKLINAENLNPVSGVIVGIYNEQDDSVFSKKPFLRIGKTDETGSFTIGNIKPGNYKLFGLGDTNRDYKFQPGESLAFHDSIVVPTVEITEKRDTVWLETEEIDTIKITRTSKLLPEDLLLRYFKEDKKRQYLVKSERASKYNFSLIFNAPQTDIPRIEPINFEWANKHLVQKSNKLDSLTYWLTDSTVWNVDTLMMAVHYQITDSVFQMVNQTDTLSLAQRGSRTPQRGRQEQANGIEQLSFSHNISGTFDLYNPVYIRFKEPLASIDTAGIDLSLRVDTLLKPLKVNWQQADSSKMVYTISHKWESEKTYELKIDSSTFTSIYGNKSDIYTGVFKIRSLDEYSAVRMNLAEYDSLVVFQILDTKDVVLATKPATPKGTLFEYLKPGDYYVRMFIDRNQNGKWDTGNLSTRTQPEEVYYYNKKLTLMKNWEFEEIWDYKATPLLQQKPAELLQDENKKK